MNSSAPARYLGVCLLVFTAVITSGYDQGPRIVQAVRTWSGADSQATESGYFCVVSQDEWVSLWKQHAGVGSAVPKVNFDTDLVVAVFETQGFSSYGVRLSYILQERDGLSVHVTSETYQSASLLGAPQGTPVPRGAPYGIFVIPRMAKSLSIVESWSETLWGGPMVCRERARFTIDGNKIKTEYLPDRR